MRREKERGTLNEHTVEGTGGVKVFVRSWQPEGKPRATVVINHGFKSHSGYYEWTAEQLTQNQLAVYALDMRGHGRSEGERLFVNEMAEYVDDLAKVIAFAKQREGALPTFVLGHSAGGVVASTYMLDHQSEVTGFICESFAHEVPAPDFALAILKGIGSIAPHAHVLKLKDEDFSRDPEVVERMGSDPLVSKQGYQAQTVAELVRADERLRKEFSRITLPVLILHGTADRATKPHGSQVFYDRASSEDKTLKLYDGHFHDLLNDLGKERVMADIADWILTRAR
jgi:alpha-beta hydrolase superfamily lysophospholipase